MNYVNGRIELKLRRGRLAFYSARNVAYSREGGREGGRRVAAVPLYEQGRA
jgi:hypothetical protein